MRKLLTGICATALALSMTATSLVSANAAPFIAAPAKADLRSDVIPAAEGEFRDWSPNTWIRKRGEARRDHREARREWRRDRREARREWRRDRREWRRDRREARRWHDDGPGWYRGHRGYRDYRPGYRRHGDFWFPAAAFVAGALVTGAIANSQPRVVYRDGGSSHTEWCYNRYRSYRASDNTFQPYNGPRQQCYSPYN